MRPILMIVVGILLVTYARGWYVHVREGSMDTASYTEYYGREVNDQIRHFLERAGKAIDAAKRPLPARKPFKL